MTIVKTIEIYFDKDPETNKEGDFSREIDFPAKWEICYDCRGKGTTYLGWRSKDQPAFTREDFDREGPDFMQDYMNGHYDADCQGCGGSGKIKIIDEGQCTTVALKYFLQQYNDYLQCLADDARTIRAEMGMGA